MIELKFTGICEGCKHSELELEDDSYYEYDDECKIWRVSCIHEEVCRMWRQKELKDTVANSRRKQK